MFDRFLEQWGKIVLIGVVLAILGTGFFRRDFGVSLSHAGLWLVPALAIFLVWRRCFDRPVPHRWPVALVVIACISVNGFSAWRLTSERESYGSVNFQRLGQAAQVEVPDGELAFQFFLKGELQRGERSGSYRFLVSRQQTRDVIRGDISEETHNEPAMGGAMTKKSVTRRTQGEHRLELTGAGPLRIAATELTPSLSEVSVVIGRGRASWLPVPLLALLCLLGVGVQSALARRGQYAPLALLCTASAAYALSIRTWNYDSPLNYFVGICLLSGVGALVGFVLGGIAGRIARRDLPATA